MIDNAQTTTDGKRPLTNKERQARWRARHPEEARKAHRDWQRKRAKRLSRRIGRKTVSQLRARMKFYAKKKAIPFDLPQGYFLPKNIDPCHLCGIQLDFVRVIMSDPARGYVESNLKRMCESCYHLCRVIRYRSGVSDFKLWQIVDVIRRIVRYQDRQSLNVPRETLLLNPNHTNDLQIQQSHDTSGQGET